jgi:hypothetical protein
MGITNLLPLRLSRKGSGESQLAESEQVGAPSRNDNRDRAHATGATENDGALHPVASGERLWTTPEAAKYLGVSVRWLQGMGLLPKVNLARPGAKRATVRYRKRDLDAYVEGQVVSPSRGEGR